jgi:hypothetical protein
MPMLEDKTRKERPMRKIFALASAATLALAANAYAADQTSNITISGTVLPTISIGSVTCGDCNGVGGDATATIGNFATDGFVNANGGDVTIAISGNSPFTASMYTAAGALTSGANTVPYTLKLGGNGIVNAADHMTLANADTREYTQGQDVIITYGVAADPLNMKPAGTYTDVVHVLVHPHV